MPILSGRLINTILSDEIYNFATQSHVQVSFEVAKYTANSDALGTLRILDAFEYWDCSGYFGHIVPVISD